MNGFPCLYQSIPGWKFLSVPTLTSLSCPKALHFPGCMSPSRADFHLLTSSILSEILRLSMTGGMLITDNQCILCELQNCPSCTGWYVGKVGEQSGCLISRNQTLNHSVTSNLSQNLVKAYMLPCRASLFWPKAVFWKQITLEWVP